MNGIKYIILLSIFLTTYICAEADISAQIAQLKNAKKSEKYIIMNKIKIQIAKLNSAQRSKAISQLRGAMSNTGNIQLPQITVPKPLQSFPQMKVPMESLPIQTPPVVMPISPPVDNIPKVKPPVVIPAPPSPGDTPVTPPPVTIPSSLPKGGQ